MTDREKLTKLILDHTCVESEEDDCGGHHDCSQCLADYLIANGVTFQKWIPVSERLPEEHDSFFARFYGTKRWLPTMFRKVSDEVIVFIKYEDGSTSVKTQKTEDGKWNISSIWQAEVTHWMPLPEPPKEV